ncbi:MULTISPECIES: tetratricopeptide repeat protein [unclassified Rhodanobacter]|uniref:tetratricopeptide repeat protein n=1 Tax=unclassified Rhodanobacter TaxID=2621553 RepID=UPI001BDE59FC|nr:MULTISPECIES: tetratricopeptide repeat protein [unclassified Rhodanobacter]MBT2144123.1 tetratricopeptide repeat protein [Rhodanobacter sp. LX-99]MBT2150210.1 tetratricopeptide repeat protein [Rhodanobacter sp. LX-100]
MKHVRGLTVLASIALLLGVASSPAMARKSDDAKPKKEVLYPNATRAEPKLDLTSEKDQKNLNEGLDAVNAGDKAKAQQMLQPIIDGSKSKYAQALALQGMASLHYNDGDYKGAISSLQRSLALGVMPNDTYFQLMYMLAQFQMADEQYQPALDTIAKWRAEGKKETADSYALEGNAEYRLGKYPEAIASINKAKSLTDKPQPTWDQILMASYSESGQDEKAAELAKSQLSSNPSDPNALNNAVAVLMQAHKYPEAIQMMEKARAEGKLSKDTQYVNLAKLYLVTGQESADPAPNATKAQQVLEEGMSKGVVKPDAETYVLLGQSAEIANNIDKAIAYYNKAQPIATDGEAALRAGRLLLSENKYSQAKGLIQQAIDKGVKHKGTAYMLLAESERGLKNKPAAIAAMKKAAQDPETAAKAKDWLKKTGAG